MTQRDVAIDRQAVLCELLVLRCQRGDPSAFDELLAAFERPLFYYVRRLVAYNFGEKPARGKLTIGGAATPAGELAIQPGAREERTIRVHGAGDIPVRLDLGELGQAVVFARVTMTPTTKATATQPAQ